MLRVSYVDVADSSQSPDNEITKSHSKAKHKRLIQLGDGWTAWTGCIDDNKHLDECGRHFVVRAVYV